jgi:hypothetical protein
MSDSVKPRRRTRPEGWVDANVVIPAELKTRLEAAAAERMVAPHVIAERAISLFLDRLIPVDQVRWAVNEDVKGTPIADD